MSITAAVADGSAVVAGAAWLVYRSVVAGVGRWSRCLLREVLWYLADTHRDEVEGSPSALRAYDGGFVRHDFSGTACFGTLSGVQEVGCAWVEVVGRCPPRRFVH